MDEKELETAEETRQAIRRYFEAQSKKVPLPPDFTDQLLAQIGLPLLSPVNAKRWRLK